jgi:hypothetical protein
MTDITYDSFKCPICESTFIFTLAPDFQPKKPRNWEVSKLKLFIEIFLALSGDDKKDVNQDNFINELLLTGKFSGDEARLYIKKAMDNGQIFERKPALLAKA